MRKSGTFLTRETIHYEKQSGKGRAYRTDGKCNFRGEYKYLDSDHVEFPGADTLPCLNSKLPAKHERNTGTPSSQR